MKYMITMAASAEKATAFQNNPEAMGKEISQMIEQIKPDSIFFSTIRRLIFIVVNIEDPHVKLRNVFEALSKYGKVTIDPVSSLDEFSRFMKQQ